MSSNFPFKRIAIIGLGLIGGSLARAVKRYAPGCVISACNARDESIKKALALGVIDYGSTDPVQAVMQAEIIILGTPLGLYKPILDTIIPHLKPGTIITDVGSVKTYVAQVAVMSLPPEHIPFFVPGHPIAGSEKSGVEASDAGLYHQKKVILTPLSSTDQKALHQVRAMWEACGAEVEFMEPEQHDRLYAENSHLVQLTAYGFLSSMLILGKKVLRYIPDTLDEEFRTFIRLGGSNTTMWSDIFIHNCQALMQTLGRMQHNLGTLISDIEKENTSHIKQRFANARNHRSMLHDRLTSNISPLTIDEGRVYTILFAYLVASLIMQTTSNVSYAGSGLRDFTSILITRGRVSPELILKEKSALLEALRAFQSKLDSFGQLIQSQQTKALTDALEDSVTLYGHLLGQKP